MIGAPAGNRDEHVAVRLMGAGARSASVSLFGDAQVAARHPDIQINYAYNVDNEDTNITVTGTGAVSQSNALAQVTCGAGIGIGHLRSHDAVRYRCGHDGYSFFTVRFDPAEVGSYQFIGPMNSDNGFAVGYDDQARFGFLHRRAGVDTFYPLADSSNIGVLDDLQKTFPGNAPWNPQSLTAFKIEWGYLGIVPPVAYIYAGYWRGWVPFFVLNVTNTLETTHITNPNLPISAFVGRLAGSGAAVTLRTASWEGGTVGALSATAGNRHFTAENVKVVDTTLTNIISVRNKANYAGLLNHIRSELEFITGSADGAKNVKFFLVENATLGGTPAWTDVDTINSVMETDVAGTTVTGGKRIIPLACDKTGSVLYQAERGDILAHPGDMWTLACQSLGTTSEIDGGIHWNEGH